MLPQGDIGKNDRVAAPPGVSHISGNRETKSLYNTHTLYATVHRSRERTTYE
jgi:hypothetical protein